MSPILVVALIALVVASPYVTFLIVKFGAYGYFMAKRQAQGKEVKQTMKDQ